MEKSMDLKLRIALAAAIFLTGATSASAVERTFNSPRMHGVPIDFCYKLGSDCGQRPADVFCQSEGYERAAKFDTEKRRPTRVIGERVEANKICDAAVCTAFKAVTCFANGSKPGPAKGFPPILD
jgi:hypothetical protein